MQSSSLPFSRITKLESNDEDEPKKNMRDKWKKEKELDELRKLGSVPAAVDEEGKDINPHIPQYISVTPWYFGSTGPTLKHQRPQPEKQEEFDHLSKYYARGQKGLQSQKYRKGACENCGALGHKKKDCFERPRKIGAKYKSVNICSDDVQLPDLKLDFDGKRDRWNGYDPSDYKAVIEEHQKVEEYKRQLKADRLKDGEEMEKNDEEDMNDDEDDEKYAENIDMPGTKVDSKQRITVRNLRIREDTAKYLRNLDPNSAHYDPKTRSMRDNPYKNTGKTSEEVDFAGENFIRFTGDTIEQAKTQLFAWEAYEKGVDVSLLAEPTKLELLQKEFSKKKEEFKSKISDELLEKYGGKEHLNAPPRELLLAQTENYVEYSRLGKIIKGGNSEIIRSKYEEDVYPNNHTSVWGSYWISGNWGYRCCHSFIKNSYCTGEAGKSAQPTTTIDLPEQTVEQENEHEEQEEEKTLVEIHKEKMDKKNKKKKKNKKSKRNKTAASKESENSSMESDDSSDSEDNEEKRKKRLRLALIKAKLEEDQGKMLLEQDERSRSYNSMYDEKKHTEEEIEAFQIRRTRTEDPMNSFMNK